MSAESVHENISSFVDIIAETAVKDKTIDKNVTQLQKEFIKTQGSDISITFHFDILKMRHY